MFYYASSFPDIGDKYKDERLQIRMYGFYVDDVNRFSFNIWMEGTSESWILLDSQRTVNIFSDKFMLSNII